MEVSIPRNGNRHLIHESTIDVMISDIKNKVIINSLIMFVD